MPRRAKINEANPISRRLFLTRLALGYTEQGKFADAAEIGRNTYNPFETSKRTITRGAANKLRDRFGLTLEWIYEGVPDRLPYALVMRLDELGALSESPSRGDRPRK